MSGGLPTGWTYGKLSDVASVQSGVGFPIKYQGGKEGQYPVYKVGDISRAYLTNHGVLNKSENYVSEAIAFEMKGKIFPVGTTLFAKIGEALMLNRRVYVAKEGLADNNVIGVLADFSDSEKFMYRFLQSFDVASLSRSTTVPSIRKSDLEEIALGIPPLNEQIRIANKLDSLLAKVDSAKNRLENIPSLLKHFRQSVLAAATSGELTKEWGVGTNIEWEQLNIDDLAEVKGGKRLPKGEELVEENTGFPYIRAGQLKHGTVISTEDSRSRQLYLKPEIQSKISRYIVNKGDVYLTIVGASIGDAGVIPNNYDKANLTENAAKLTEFKKPLLSEFLAYWLRSEKMQDLIKMEIKSGAQGKLALKRIKELPVPYTTIEEQKEIVHRVETLFALANNVEKQYTEAKKHTDRLAQSLLAKALRGELVQQDPNDEPAINLLERIKLMRSEQVDKPKREQLIGSSYTPRKVMEKNTMSKSREDDDVRNQPYLASYIKKLGGKTDAEALFKLSELSVADYYKQLSWEVKQGFIVDNETNLGLPNAA